MVKVLSVTLGSHAEKAGILPGDTLISVDSHPINDVLDYRFFITEKKIRLNIGRGGQTFEKVITKGQYDDIGLEFSTFLMDEKRRCTNHCIFCFIDQNPCGMREMVYFKDDDTRLSFLMGNYVTLTNVKDDELFRLVKMRISPINISVHTTSPELRCKMLGNRFAGNILSQMKILKDGGLVLNAQIVLCRNINDGAELDRTLSDLEAFFPELQSIAIVPAGLTRHRENLYHIEPFDRKSARGIINQTEKYQKRFLEKYGSRKVFLADEFYLAADIPFPSDEEYEGYMQLDNGVGSIKNTETEILDELDFILSSDEISELKKREKSITLATGSAAEGLMKKICSEISKNAPNLHFEVIAVKNRFFGETVTVAGLLTGEDILFAVKDKKISDLIIPAVCLRHERDLFLDGMSIEEFTKRAGCRVYPTENGCAIFDTLKKIVSEG